MKRIRTNTEIKKELFKRLTVWDIERFKVYLWDDGSERYAEVLAFNDEDEYENVYFLENGKDEEIDTLRKECDKVVKYLKKLCPNKEVEFIETTV